jgi:hypothetical protein
MICNLSQKRFVIMLFFIEDSLITEIFGLNTIGIIQVYAFIINTRHKSSQKTLIGFWWRVDEIKY